MWLIGEIFITGSGSGKEKDAVNKLAGSPRGKSHALAHATQRCSTDTRAALLPWCATEAVAVVKRRPAYRVSASVHLSHPLIFPLKGQFDI